MEKEKKSTGPLLRVPLQTVPVTRALAGMMLSGSADGVRASMTARELACSVAAGMGGNICIGNAGRCADALYAYCMS